MKRKIKKLALSKETLRFLSHPNLKAVAGGLVPSNNPEDYTCRCDTEGDASCVLSCISYCQHC
jgi:hypothetical protein